MANLKKREIVILAVAVISVVLYIAYAFFFSDGQKGAKVEAGKEPVKTEKIISRLTDELNRSKLSDFDNYIIRKANIHWSQNPFLKRDLYRAWLAKDSKGEGVNAVKIIYSGYVDTGKQKLAVLNGIEYRIGEELKEEGYVLKNISSSKVIIFDKRAGNNLEITIQE
jgi:hypothetical protein